MRMKNANNVFNVVRKFWSSKILESVSATPKISKTTP
jgi:hypothetical protein